MMKICSSEHAFYENNETCEHGHVIQKTLCPRCLEPIIYKRFPKHFSNCEHSIYKSISFKLKQVAERYSLFSRWKPKLGRLTGYDLCSFLHNVTPDRQSKSDIITRSCVYPLVAGKDIYIFHVVISGMFYTVGKYIPVFTFDRLIENNRRNNWVNNAISTYDGINIQPNNIPQDIQTSTRVYSPTTNEFYWVFPYDTELEAVELHHYLPLLVYGLWSRNHICLMKELIKELFFFHVMDFSIGYDESEMIS